MTRSKQGAADLAPSLFPFLAVLLCTVGALVLLLVLVVGQSQAAVKQATDEKKQQSAELRVQVELIRDGFKEDREKLQLAIEKKRLMLQGLEKQSSELLKEMEELAKTAEQIDKQLAGKELQASDAAKLTDLQRQLQEAAEKLKTKVSQPSGDKPVFAIIPYEGNNGTHRRPIYLECRADGVMVQPEGVLIGIKDLKPPYGPGNPLDATLRTIRTYYSPQGSALNSSAYPLLVVRSSGIRTYALARMAMAGWDDQFGYELIEDDAELTFPESEPGLSRQIEQTLVTARNRQAALVMAMPGRFRQAMEELNADNLNFDPIEGEGDGLGGDSAGNVVAGGNGENGGMPGGQPMALGGGGPGRGGFAFAPDAAGGSFGSRPGSPPGSPAASSGAMGFATGGESQGQTPALSPGNAWQAGPAGTNSAGSAALPEQSFAAGALSGNQFTRGSDGALQGQSGEGGGQQATDPSKAGAPNNAGTRPGNFRDAMAAARSKQMGNADSQSSASTLKGQNSSAADAGTGGSQMTTALADGFGSMSGSPSEISAETNTPTASMSARKAEKVDAVAKRKGRNWAWAAGPARETAVVRTIRVACYQDRWIVLPEQYGTNKAETVMLDVAMQTSAEQLAKVIADRVDRWGIALSGGYWKPVLAVEVMPGAEERYDQLRRLLDGSGLEVQPAPKAATSPTTRPIGR